MSKTPKKDAKPISLKKETYRQLNSQLTVSLSWLKELLGEKKFDSRVKKAARLLSDGIKEKVKTKEKKANKVKPGNAEPIVEQ